MKKFLVGLLTAIMAICVCAFVTACDESSSTTSTGFSFTFVSAQDSEDEVAHYAIKGINISSDDADNVDTDNFEIKYQDTVIFKGGVLDLSKFAGLKYKDKEITEISLSAFANKTYIKEVVIGSNITLIGNGCLAGCTSLEKVTVPFIGNKADSMDADKMFAYIFGTAQNDESNEYSVEAPFNTSTDCTKTTYYIPSSLKEVVINNTTMTKISECQFYGLTSLKKVTIPTTTTMIAASAFNGCTGLKEVAGLDNVKDVLSNAFNGCTSLAKFDAPELTKVGESAFNGCTSLYSSVLDVEKSLNTFTIGTKLTSIGKSAYAGCTGFKYLVINSECTIDDSAFSGCTGLIEIEFNGNITLKNRVFSDCSNLVVTTFNGTVTQGQDDFANCDKRSPV